MSDIRVSWCPRPWSPHPHKESNWIKAEESERGFQDIWGPAKYLSIISLGPEYFGTHPLSTSLAKIRNWRLTVIKTLYKSRSNGFKWTSFKARKVFIDLEDFYFYDVFSFWNILQFFMLTSHSNLYYCGKLITFICKYKVLQYHQTRLCSNAKSIFFGNSFVENSPFSFHLNCPRICDNEGYKIMIC